MPRRMALRHVEPFVREKQPWIERTLRRYQDAAHRRRRARRPARRRRGARTWASSSTWTCASSPAARARTSAAAADVLTVKVAKRGPRADPRRARALVPPPGARRGRAAAGRRGRPRGHVATPRSRSGQQRTRWASLLVERVDELQLAAAARARRRSSTTSSSTRSRTSRCSTTRRASGGWSGAAVPDYKQHERWLRAQRPGAAALSDARSTARAWRCARREPDDADALFELGRDPEVVRFFSWGPYRERAEAEAFIERVVARAARTSSSSSAPTTGRSALTGLTELSERDRPRGRRHLARPRRTGGPARTASRRR